MNPENIIPKIHRHRENLTRACGYDVKKLMEHYRQRENDHKPPTNVINSLADFVEIVVKYFPNNKWIFRGQTDISDSLRPKAGRDEYFLSNPKEDDLARFNKWSEEAVAFYPKLPRNDLERLALAQHYGLATRLLDWTANAVVALYFATEENQKSPGNSDGGVFIYRKPTAINLKIKNLKSCKKIRFYKPRPVDRRIMAQDGVFTFHPKPEKTLKAKPFALKKGTNEPDGNLVVLHVPVNKKRILQEELRAIGILARSVYPDIEGLSKSINYVTHWMADPR